MLLISIDLCLNRITALVLLLLSDVLRDHIDISIGLKIAWNLIWFQTFFFLAFSFIETSMGAAIQIKKNWQVSHLVVYAMNFCACGIFVNASSNWISKLFNYAATNTIRSECSACIRSKKKPEKMIIQIIWANTNGTSSSKHLCKWMFDYASLFEVDTCSKSCVQFIRDEFP